MIDFSLTKEQVMIQKAMREFAEKELLPNYSKYDQSETFPWEQWKKMAELGVMGLGIPSEYGGQPADQVTTGIIVKELARGDVNSAYAATFSGLIGVIVKYASEEIKKEWLPEFAKGERVIALAVTEPHMGSDVGSLRTTAVKENEYYVLNGEKSSASFAMDCDAALVFAKTNPDVKAQGVSCFLVPMDTPGLTRQPYKDMGARAIRRGSFFFDDVKIPAQNLIGEENKGFYQIVGAFDVLRVLLSLQAIGAAEKSLEETMGYVKSRTAFGKPLAKFEGVSFPIAEHYTKMMAGQWLCYHALWMHDKGLKHSKETAMCKYYCPEEAVKAIHSCLLLHGHYGYAQDFPIEQRLRDVTSLELADGTAQIQKIIISRELMGREYLPY
jgi:cyclohexanecarboxyl-CoA dehydrogenase